jgi:hypothetical protein
VKTESEYQENQLAAFQIGLHHSETGALVEPMDTNVKRFANCRWHPQTVVIAMSGYLAPSRLCAFPMQKANDHSLLEFHQELVKF